MFAQSYIHTYIHPYIPLPQPQPNYVWLYVHNSSIALQVYICMYVCTYIHPTNFVSTCEFRWNATCTQRKKPKSIIQTTQEKKLTYLTPIVRPSAIVASLSHSLKTASSSHNYEFKTNARKVTHLLENIMMFRPTSRL